MEHIEHMIITLQKGVIVVNALAFAVILSVFIALCVL
jgi:hypothetical protein